MRYAAIFGCFLLSFAAWGQTYRGQVLDSLSRRPIAYVNIGIVGQGLGTVSDPNGQFRLAVPDSLQTDLVRFSCVGYRPVSFRVSDFILLLSTQSPILMQEDIMALPEIVIKKEKLKKDIWGRRNTTKQWKVGSAKNQLGHEFGIYIQAKAQPAFLDFLELSIAENHYGLVKFRLNVYNTQDGLPHQLLNRENNLVQTRIQKGIWKINLKPYEIVVNGDFCVVLEWIEDLGEDALLFSWDVKPNNDNYTVSRLTSQDEWSRNKTTPGFWVGVSY
ncbi:MAG: carboxypeptidase-like regulatory domain-containing protein [Microscillaceae bacterium]|nr:carboxypeptidase-like regulatory domain-containing protein [Microscillaceae bacterium]